MTLRLGNIPQALGAAVLRVLNIPSLAVGVYLQKTQSEFLTMTLRLRDIAQAFVLSCGSVHAQNIIRIVDHEFQTMGHCPLTSLSWTSWSIMTEDVS